MQGPGLLSLLCRVRSRRLLELQVGGLDSSPPRLQVVLSHQDPEQLLHPLLCTTMQAPWNLGTLQDHLSL